MEDIRDLVAFNLRRLRNAKKLTQEQLAFSAEIDRSYVSLLESGKYSASVTMLNTLAGALGVEITEFFVKRRSTSKSS